MSVSDVRELNLERGAKIGATTMEVWRVWQVTTTVMTDGPLVAAAADDVAQVGDHHPDEDSLICYSQDPKPFMDGVTWRVQCNYRVPSSTGGGQISSTTYPWSLPADISYSYGGEQKPLENCYAVYYNTDEDTAVTVRGFRNKKVTNSSQQPFDPPRMYTEYFPIISVQRNTKGVNFDKDILAAYQGTINKDDITIDGMTVSQYQGQCRDYKAQPAWFTRPGQSPILYYQETIEIVIKEENWIEKITDSGFYSYSGGSLTRLLDTLGNGLVEPVLLNGSGQKLGDGKDPKYVYCHILFERYWEGWLPK